MQLSRFNNEGIREFQLLLQKMREGTVIESLLGISEDNALVEPVENGKDVTIQLFDTRLDMAAYLNPILVDAAIKNDMVDVGLWAWLSAVFIDSVCPKDIDGKRNPRHDYRHIPTTDYRNFYRHLIRGPLRIYRLFRDNPEKADIVLYQNPSAPGDFVEQLGSRQERITNPAIIAAANHLYYDRSKKKPKVGTGANWKKPGTLRRYLDLLGQLDLTYDLYSMSDEDILKVLPGEFSTYR